MQQDGGPAPEKRQPDMTNINPVQLDSPAHPAIREFVGIELKPNRNPLLLHQGF